MTYRQWQETLPPEVQLLINLPHYQTTYYTTNGPPVTTEESIMTPKR